MCKLTENIFNVVEAAIGGETFDKPYNIRIRKNGNYTIGTTNIYPAPESVSELFMKVSGAVERYASEYARENGEIQIYRVESGSNTDLGVHQSNIKQALIIELYCYKCQGITIVRILHEEGLYYKGEWISVDVDEHLGAPWFEED